MPFSHGVLTTPPQGHNTGPVTPPPSQLSGRGLAARARRSLLEQECLGGRLCAMAGIRDEPRSPRGTPARKSPVRIKAADICQFEKGLSSRGGSPHPAGENVNWLILLKSSVLMPAGFGNSEARHRHRVEKINESGRRLLIPVLPLMGRVTLCKASGHSGRPCKKKIRVGLRGFLARRLSKFMTS